VGCKKCGGDEAAQSGDASAVPSVARAIVPSGGCATEIKDDVAPCTGTLGGKLDKYAWTVSVAGEWEVTVTQPKELSGFRPVLIVWKDPDTVIQQDDVALIGGRAHVVAKLEPGAYRISVVNGNKEQMPPEGYPYTLSITHK
jgi:hypothetical protein